MRNSIKRGCYTRTDKFGVWDGHGVHLTNRINTRRNRRIALNHYAHQIGYWYFTNVPQLERGFGWDDRSLLSHLQWVREFETLFTNRKALLKHYSSLSGIPMRQLGRLVHKYRDAALSGGAK